MSTFYNWRNSELSLHLDWRREVLELFCKTRKKYKQYYNMVHGDVQADYPDERYHEERNIKNKVWPSNYSWNHWWVKNPSLTTRARKNSPDSENQALSKENLDLNNFSPTTSNTVAAQIVGEGDLRSGIEPPTVVQRAGRCRGGRERCMVKAHEARQDNFFA